MESDATLVSRVLAGDHFCFELLVERYQGVLFNLALRMVGDHDEAQDVAQTAFVKAFRNLGSFDPGRRFFSWIYRITINESLIVRAARRPHEDLAESIASSIPNALDSLEHADQIAALHRAIDALPEIYRDVVLLRHRSELSYQEIAEVLSIPVKTVKSRLFTARRQLVATLRPKASLTAKEGRSA